MTPCALRYQASRDWMEHQLLSGIPLNHRRQVLVIESDTLPSDLNERLERILDSSEYLSELERVAVLDSGIDPTIQFGRDKQSLTPMDQAVVTAVGALPELPEPSDDAGAVIGAWEAWLDRYRAAALVVIGEYNSNPPAFGMGPRHRAYWGTMEVNVQGFEFAVSPGDGAQAMQDLRAGLAWVRHARDRFSKASVEAAREATGPPREGVRMWWEEESPEAFAKGYWNWSRRFFAAAKAHHRALHSAILDFDDEMERWAGERGSERLRLGIADGYRMNARYLTERLAAEAPGFYAMPTRAATDGWAKRTNSPSENALLLRRAVDAAISKSAPATLEGPPEVEIYDVVDPPVEVYVAKGGNGTFADLPHPRGWHWEPDGLGGTIGSGPNPFEAVVVRNWLGRFTLIGAVRGADGNGPPSVWAVPEPDRFSENGVVEAGDPDAPQERRAKRKPPGSAGGEDDIPF